METHGNEWIAKERQLWDSLWAWPEVLEDSRAGARLVLKAKLAGKPKPKLLTSEEATARSWKFWDEFIGH